jgi:hypothetical protein
VKAGLKLLLPEEGFGAPCPTTEGGGRAGREAGGFEEELRPGGGGYDMMNARSCTSREGCAGFSHVPDAPVCSPNRIRYASHRYRERFDTRDTQNADKAFATRLNESLDMKKQLIMEIEVAGVVIFKRHVTGKAEQI